uniref:Sulfatase N-terminal domain-containing protein n=1 Tax=Odontella aurita TaxID=265563 RepID=A0A7S4HYW6_9STRA|mmetsp:Transcript_1738/g.4626  ORF Transcript_1738/g.4626 Transcript_1738/m.4626 type:complete len:869 (+) Transcript_1738:417-3023(+)
MKSPLGKTREANRLLCSYFSLVIRRANLCTRSARSPGYMKRRTSDPPSRLPLPLHRCDGKRLKAADGSSSRATLATLLLLILIPPSVSRAITLRGKEEKLSSVSREVLIMSAVQDLTVASACLGLLLPAAMTMQLFRCSVSGSASWRLKSAASGFMGLTYAIFALCLYSLFVLPIWIDLMSQSVLGVRMRAEFAAMMIAGIDSFSSSVAIYSKEMTDRRTVGGFATAILWGILFVTGSFRLSNADCVRTSSDGIPKIEEEKKNVVRMRLSVCTVKFVSAFQLLVFIAVRASFAAGRHSFLESLSASNSVFLLAVELAGISYLEPDSSWMLRSINSHLESAALDIRSGMGSRRKFLLNTEQYVDTDTTGRYPFYRRTLGYNGTKNFEINWQRAGDGGAARTKPPNIVFLMLESWRYSDVGVLGGHARLQLRNRTATPNFDRLVSERGVLFSNFYSNSVQTSRSIPPALFGTLPHFSAWAATSLEDSPRLHMSGLPSVLKGMNYTTHFFSATDLSWQNWETFLPCHGFDRLWGYEDFNKRYEELRRAGNAPERTDAATSWGMGDGDAYLVLLDEMRRHSQDSDKPFFFDFYSLSSHHPWKVPFDFKTPHWTSDEGRDELHRVYLEALSYSDHVLGSFFSRVDELGLSNNTLFVLSGDHGYGFCDHDPCSMGWGNDKAKVWDEAVRVPMAILGGGGIVAPSSVGSVINEASSHVDLFATVMDAIGVPEGGFHQHGVGRSLMRSLPPGDDVAVLQNPHHSVVMGAKIGNVKYMFEGNGEVAVYGPGKNRHEDYDDFTPMYHQAVGFDGSDQDRSKDDDHGSKKKSGVLNDLNRVKDLVSDVLGGTKRCFSSDSFMPPGSGDGMSACTENTRY